MGHVRDAVGTIALEERRESFIVHAGYGYVPGRRELRGLRLGDEFVAPDESCQRRHWRVAVITEDYVAGREVQFSTVRQWPPQAMVEVPGLEENAPGPHARWWRNAGHPEFAYEDLDDLIVALVDLRKDRR